MKYPLAELINLAQLRQLITLFTRATELAISVVDPRGNVVIATDYQPACRDYHRVGLPSSRNCLDCISGLNTICTRQEDGWTMATCANGLVEVAIPLVLEGTHLATLLAGQFLPAPPNLEAFRRQAREFSFDEEKYLEAIRQIPVLQEDKLERILSYLAAVSEVVGKIALEKYHKLEEVNDELASAQQHLQLLAQQIPGFLWSTDTSLKITLATGSILSSLDLYPGQMEGVPLREAFPLPVGDELVIDQHRAALQGNPVQFEMKIKDLLLEAYLGPLRSLKGEIIGALGLAWDVTEQRHMQAELLASEEKFRTLAESTSALIYILQGETVVYANPALQKLSGYSWDEFRSRKFWELVHPDDHQMVKKLGLKRQQGDLSPDRYELRLATKSGAIRWIDLTARYYTFQGQPAVLASAFDITERKKMEASLLDSEAQYRTVVQDQTDLVVRFLPNGTITFANDACLQYYQLSREQLLGFNFMDYLAADKQKEVQKILTGLQTESGVSNLEYCHSDINGTSAWQHWTGRAIKDEWGQVREYQAVGRDITKRKIMEDELSRQRESLALFLENSPAGTAIIDREGRIVYLNARAQMFTGYSLEDVPTMDAWLTLAYPNLDYRQRIMTDWFQQLKEKGTARGLVRARGKDGELHYLDFYGVPLVNGQTVISVWDITWQKRVEEELRISEARFKALTDASFEGIIISENGVVIEANQRAAEICGYEAQGLVGMHFSSLSAPESREIIKSHVESQVGLPYEATALRPDGVRVPVEIQGRMVTYKNRRVRASAVRDLSERKKSAEEIERKNKNLQALFYNTPDAVAMGGRDQIIADVNPRFTALFGYSREECIGRRLDDLLLPEEYHSDYQKHLRLTRQGLTITTEAIRRNKQGELIDVFLKVIPIANFGYYVIYSDISERKAAEKTIALQLQELEAKNAEMERFTYTVSHDLRSPLITIKGFAGLMLEDLHNRDVTRLEADLERIINASDKMDELLRDLLELSRVGRLLNPYTHFSMYEIACEAAELLAGRLQERGANLDIAPDLPRVWADRARIREVIQNLVENAVKFLGDNPNPQIQVGWEHRSEENIFFVRDNGIGIAPRYLEKVFGLFDQLDPHSEGTGIGLALVRRIIEFHEGRIWVESPGPGQGACFYFTLPVEKEE